MKKLIALLGVALLSVSMAVSAYAQSDAILNRGNPGDPPHPNHTQYDQEEPIEKVEVESVDPDMNAADKGSLFDDPDWYRIFGYETDPRIDNPDWTLEDGKKHMGDDTGENAIGSDRGNPGDNPGGIIREGGNTTGGGKNGFILWILTFGGILVLGTAAIIFVNRTRFIPALQTNNGNIITRGALISRKQTIAAIKNSAITPSDDVFKSIMEKVDRAQK